MNVTEWLTAQTLTHATPELESVSNVSTTVQAQIVSNVLMGIMKKTVNVYLAAVICEEQTLQRIMRMETPWLVEISSKNLKIFLYNWTKPINSRFHKNVHFWSFAQDLKGFVLTLDFFGISDFLALSGCRWNAVPLEVYFSWILSLKIYLRGKFKID